MNNQSEADRLYLLVGRCLTAWNQIEERVMHLIEYAHMRGDYDADEAVHGYWAVVSFEARLKWCSAIVNMRTATPEYQELNERWNALNNHLIKKARKRAEIAHGSVVELFGARPAFHPFYHRKIALFNRLDWDVRRSVSFHELHPPLDEKELSEREKGFRETEDRIKAFSSDWIARDKETNHPSQAF